MLQVDPGQCNRGSLLYDTVNAIVVSEREAPNEVKMIFLGTEDGVSLERRVGSR